MRVIIAIDQTNNWKQVVAAVAKKKWPKDVAFKILSVLQPSEWQDMEYAATNNVLPQIIKLRQKHAEDILLEAREEIVKKIPSCAAHVELRNGSPRAQIIESAVDWMANKIVLGAHGQAQNRLLPSTVAHGVAQYARCSVELVRLQTNPLVDSSESHKETTKV